MNQKYFTILLALSFALTVHSQINRDDAFAILKNTVLGSSWQDKEIYSLNNIVSNSTIVNTLDSFVVSPDYPCWFFYIDMDPSAEWWHPCKYVFINASNGTIVEMNLHAPPDMDSLINLNRILPLSTAIDPNDFYSIPKISTQSNNDDFAVIISGGSRIQINWPRYWNHCSAVYQVLVNRYGYKRDHIYVIMSDGTNPSPDYNNGSYNNIIPASYPLDLDGDGNDDIQYAATKANISFVFNQLQQRVTTNENVFVFVTDHGGEGSTITLWNGVKMTKNEFLTEINKINNAKAINLCMLECFGGGYASYLTGKNRVITTACSATETARAMPPNYIYSEFCYHWLSAVTGFTPDNNTFVNADYNSDGYVSLEEAFYYANTNDTRPETPQYYSNKPCLGASMDLNGVFNYSCFGIDLYTRDNSRDNGIEPLMNSFPGITDSPDIWVRNQQDGDTIHQAIIHGTNYLYVRIANRGSDTSWTSDSIKVYTKPAFLHYFNSYPHAWQLLCKAKLPRIAGGRDTVVCIPFNSSDLSITGLDYGFYTRIESPFDPLNNTEINSVSRNVEDNNNISLKNVLFTNILRMANNYGLAVSFVTTAISPDNPYSGFRLNFNVNDLNILNEAEVTIVFPEDLITDWTPTSENIKQLTANTFLVTGETVEITDVPETDVTLRYNFLTNGNTPDNIFKNHITQYVGDDEELVGGLTIQVEKPERAANEMFTANAGNDTAILIGTNATLHATQINETATYRWYDKQRTFKYEGLNYTVTPTETSEYILEVTAESDGYRDLDTVKVNVVPGCIRSITPNPVSDNWVTVSYEYASTVTSAHLYIYNTGTTTLVGNYDLSNLDNVGGLDIEVTNYPTGSYTVVLVCDNAVCHSKILIRQ
jgi:hypothetical protein